MNGDKTNSNTALSKNSNKNLKISDYSNNNDKYLQRTIISAIAGGMSSVYQFSLLKNNKMTFYPKLGISCVSFLFCFTVTNFVLKNFESIEN